MSQYYFRCACDRCKGIDTLRPINCGSCDDGVGIVWMDSLKDIWTCKICSEQYDAARADEDLYVDVEEQAEAQLKVFDDVGDNSDGEQALLGSVEGVNTLLKYLPSAHWTVIFMKRVVLEMSLRGATELSTDECERYAFDIAEWVFDVIFPYSPVSAACLLHTYRKILFQQITHTESSSVSSGHVFILSAKQQREKKLLTIMKTLFVYYEIQYGLTDSDVLEWKRHVHL